MIFGVRSIPKKKSTVTQELVRISRREEREPSVVIARRIDIHD
jgi:hypothetical protein